MHATDDLESLTGNKQPGMQRVRPHKPYLKVHAQHVEALVIAAVEYEAAQGIRMLPEGLQHLIKLLDGTALLAGASFPAQHDGPESGLQQAAFAPTVAIAVFLVVRQQVCVTES